MKKKRASSTGKGREFCLLRWLTVALFADRSRLLLAGAEQVRAQQDPLLLPSPSEPVNDYANVIDAQTKMRLQTILTSLKQSQQIEIAVVTVPTTNGEDIFDYSMALARRWGIGSKEGEKNGLLLVVAVNDRKYFTQVSRHLEGDLPDGLAGQIQREQLVPQFKRGNYAQGIFDTVQAYVATLAEKRNFSIEGIDKSNASRADRGNYESRRGRSAKSGVEPSTAAASLLSSSFAGFAVLSSARAGAAVWRSLKRVAAGFAFQLHGWRRRGGSSGWSGGGFGGGGGGFGGFGGGGDFGGGGAGGSW